MSAGLPGRLTGALDRLRRFLASGARDPASGLLQSPGHPLPTDLLKLRQGILRLGIGPRKVPDDLGGLSSQGRGGIPETA